MSREILWVGYPKSYTKGRQRPIQFVTLHYTAGSEGATSAESGVAYDKVRTDGTSAHYYTDSVGPALQEVPDGDRAHTARKHGNEIGIHIEICGTVQTRAQWLDSTSMATLKTTAYVVAVLLKRHNLAFKRLTTSETRAAYYNPSGSRPTGINDHNACTKAFPEDGGTHTDVGPEFPWDVFMDLVADELNEGEDEDMRLTFFLADGGYWRSNGTTIRRIPSGGDFTQIKDRGDCFPDEDANGFPTPDIILDPERGGWTWEQIKLAYGEDEALMVATVEVEIGPVTLTDAEHQRIANNVFTVVQRAEDE